jgi:hypothetical protein
MGIGAGDNELKEVKVRKVGNIGVGEERVGLTQKARKLRDIYSDPISTFLLSLFCKAQSKTDIKNRPIWPKQKR